MRLRKTRSSIFTLILLQAISASAQDADFDALALESAPQSTTAQMRDTKFFVEGAVGSAGQRYQTDNRNIGRASFDLSHTSTVSPGLRASFSDRVDYFDPRQSGSDRTVNSLREAFLTWQPDGAGTVIEMGRVNLRYGPGYGYNPTDFFRDGSLRTLTTADPFALRENRLGTVLVRAQRLWSDGSLSVAYSPKMADKPSTDGWDLDLGATNNRNRALIVFGSQFSPSVSSQMLAYKEDGLAPALGANLTALISDAAVGHLEWSRSTEPDAARRALALPGADTTRNRFVGGVTYTTDSKLSVTVEYQYNGFAMAPSEWSALGSTVPGAQAAYLQNTLQRQDLASREAYLIYLTQKNLWLKNLDLTALMRLNQGDQSRMSWIELRHHWPQFDLAFQIQRTMGESTSEYGLWPDRTIVQMLGNYYF